MASIPKKVVDRLVAGVKQYQPILEAAHARDVNEADTVTIVKDMMADVFGYDKYLELTSEYCIRGSYCDLATKLDGSLGTLIEVKAIGTERPIEHELVVEIDFSRVNARSSDDLEKLYLWCKEGWTRSVLGDYQAQREALSRFFLGAVILSDPVLDVIRRELRRLSPDVRIDTDLIRKALSEEVIKREVTEGDNAESARRKIARVAKKSLRATKEGTVESNPAEVEPPVSAVAITE